MSRAKSQDNCSVITHCWIERPDETGRPSSRRFEPRVQRIAFIGRNCAACSTRTVKVRPAQFAGTTCDRSSRRSTAESLDRSPPRKSRRHTLPARVARSPRRPATKSIQMLQPTDRVAPSSHTGTQAARTLRAWDRPPRFSGPTPRPLRPQTCRRRNSSRTALVARSWSISRTPFLTARMRFPIP